MGSIVFGMRVLPLFVGSRRCGRERAARRIVCVLFYGKQRASGGIPHNKLKRHPEPQPIEYRLNPKG